jgi:hypothetical protein
VDDNHKSQLTSEQKDNAMERRWTTRMPAKLNVDLYFQSMEVVNCQTRDVSFGGVFLELHQWVPPMEASVELVFRLGEANNYRKYRIPAKVVRSTGEGVGIMFRDFDAAAFRSLREVLRHRDETAIH